MPRYEDIDAINWSSLKWMRTSPLQYKWNREHPTEPTAAMQLGTAIHTLVLEPDEFESEFVVWPRPRRGNEWKAFQDEHAGKIILTETEATRARGAASSVRSHLIASKHLQTGAREKVITWTDPDTGLPCKGRADLVNGHLVELKSSTDIQPYRFGNVAARLGYHCQLAFYEDGLAESGYELHGDTVLIVVQNTPPFDVAVYRITEDTIRAGRREYKQLLQQLLDCIASDSWPGICGDAELEFELPGWADSTDNPPSLTLGGQPLEF